MITVDKCPSAAMLDGHSQMVQALHGLQHPDDGQRTAIHAAGMRRAWLREQMFYLYGLESVPTDACDEN